MFVCVRVSAAAWCDPVWASNAAPASSSTASIAASARSCATRATVRADLEPRQCLLCTVVFELGFASAPFLLAVSSAALDL
eukprot:7811747-Alexandrium_andersonii.AAC.1